MKRQEKTKEFIKNYVYHLKIEHLMPKEIGRLYGISTPYDYLEEIAANEGCTRLDLLVYPGKSNFGSSRIPFVRGHVNETIKIMKNRIEELEVSFCKMLRMIRELKGEEIMNIESLSARKVVEYAKKNQGLIQIQQDYCCSEEEVLHRLSQLYKNNKTMNDKIAELRSFDKAFLKSLQSNKKKWAKKEKKNNSSSESVIAAVASLSFEELCAEKDKTLADIERISEEIETNRLKKENFETKDLPNLKSKLSIVEETIKKQQGQLELIKADLDEANAVIRSLDASIISQDSEREALKARLEEVEKEIEVKREVSILAYDNGSFEVVGKTNVELNYDGWEKIETELKNDDNVYLVLTGMQLRTLAKAMAVRANSNLKLKIEFEDVVISPYLR